MDPVTYIHVVKASVIAFSVYYHDIPLDIKGSSSNNNNNDASLIGAYINSNSNSIYFKSLKSQWFSGPYMSNTHTNTNIQAYTI